MKAIALRLDDELHSQLVVVAQLKGVSLTELIRSSIDAQLEQLSQDPDLAIRAQGALDTIDQEAAARRDAISRLLHPGGSAKKAGGRTSKLSSVPEEP
jgi:hypothetical protein